MSHRVLVPVGLPHPRRVRVPPSHGRIRRGGVQAETRQIMDDIRRDLERAGSSMGRVVRCLVMLADIAKWQAVNEV